MSAVIRLTSAIVAVSALAIGSRTSASEVELPRQSPPATVSQQVGLTVISVEYGSPAVRGRKIWGSVVPYDRSWSISPAQVTKVRFTRDVQIGEQVIPAGSYALTAIPTKTDWTLSLARIAGDAVAGDRTEGEPIRFRVRPKAGSANRERLTFLFSDFNDEKVSLDLEWEKVRISIPISVNTGQQVQAGIAELDTAWRSYANAARYMLETKRDYDTGLRYADQSLALKEDWYTYWIKASLMAAKGDWRGAKENGEKAYQLGQKLGDGFVLEYELRLNIADWTKRAAATENKLTAR